MRIGNLLGASAIAATLLAAPASNAQSGFSGFICEVRYEPPTGQGTGSDGDLFVTIKSAAACGGSAVASATFCSAGAANSTCAASARYTMGSLMGLYAQAYEAARASRRVQLFTLACNGGGANCARFLSLFAN